MGKLGWTTTNLPVEAVLDQVTDCLRLNPGSSSPPSLVLTAEPGAGKSSLIPLAVANSIEPGQKVVVLEPRRLAARATAERLAELLNDRVGGLVGLTVRGQHDVSNRTRIEVVTEAVLTNRLQDNPELPGVGALVFDEFHERNLHSDLGLAMALESRDTLREDLRIVVMSATIDPQPIAALLGSATILHVKGRTFPVQTRYMQRPPRQGFAPAVANAIGKAIASVERDVLAFVPGRWEIDQVLSTLEVPADVIAIGLHGGTPKTVQNEILRPQQRGRRVIVATSVAETSITVPGVEAVVDGGLLRRARFDPLSGLGRLETRFTTQFSADQRRGRAGRTCPGVCFRLWSAEDHRLLDAAVPPEILVGDPLLVAFEIARWGDPQAAALPLLDHPGRRRLHQAIATLNRLGLVRPDGRLTPKGRRAGRLPLDPRMAALVLDAQGTRSEHLALQIAALTNNDRRFVSLDLDRVLDRHGNDQQTRRATDRIKRRLEPSTQKQPEIPALDPDPSSGELLARTWPDRVGIAREARPGHFLLASGREVEVRAGESLEDAAFIVVVEADGAARSARVRLAARTDRATVLAACEESIQWADEIGYDHKSGNFRAERVQRLGAIALHRHNIAFPSGQSLQAALGRAIEQNGLDVLTWSTRAGSIRQRLAWLHREAPLAWPDVTDAALLDRLDDWLVLSSITTPTQLRSLDLGSSLLALLDWEQRQGFDLQAPTKLHLPRGGSAPIDYSSGRPVLSVRLQRLFGLDTHPMLGPNEVPLVIELLSPANRPTQITTDLPGFWRGSYQHIRRDLRGRYPKHEWPEDPLAT